MLSLWCMSRSPLMLGCDLPSSPPEALELLTNQDLLDVLKGSRNNRELLRDGHLVLLAAESTTSDDRFAAAFNTGTTRLGRTLALTDPGPSFLNPVPGATAVALVMPLFLSQGTWCVAAVPGGCRWLRRLRPGAAVPCRCRPCRQW